MSLRGVEHPDITSALQTGYPRRYRTEEEDEVHYCENCGQRLSKEVYSDRAYDYLCRDCLLLLHEKRWW